MPPKGTPEHRPEPRQIRVPSIVLKTPTKSLLCTVRIKKTAAHQSPRWFSVALATPRYLSKVRRFALQKRIQNQSVTKSILKTRSREVWRQTGPEREFRGSAGAAQCRGSHAKPVVIWALCAPTSHRRMLEATGLAVGERFERAVQLSSRQCR